MPFFVKGFVYAVLFLQQFALMATAVLGLFDVWFDFRKLVKKPA
jgi:mannose/fructose/N-acetylgalactosamine-specific phosphotransferase system component IIC